MLEILKFIFSDFWVFCGCFLFAIIIQNIITGFSIYKTLNFYVNGKEVDIEDINEQLEKELERNVQNISKTDYGKVKN